MNLPKLRKADINDIAFIIEAIIESEKSGTPRLSYQTIFMFDENKIKELIKNLLNENIEGQQYCISNFMIAEVDNNYAGTCTAWIEAEKGIHSSVVMGNFLLDFIDRSNFAETESKLRLAKSIAIPREKGTLQIDNVYVRPNYRGLGISGMLIQEVIRLHKKKDEILKVHIVLNKTNENALRSYSKLGFKTVLEKSSDDAYIQKILPSNVNILMEKLIP